MKFFNLKGILQILTVSVLTIFLCWSIFSGLKIGKELAQSEVLAKNFEETKKSFEYFVADQNRFPSRLEYTDKKIMLNYISAFPLPEFVSKTCPMSWQYQNTTVKKSIFSVCLPQRIAKFKIGWNSINFVQ